MTSIAPFLIFYVGALGVAVTRGLLQRAILLAVPIIGAVNLYYLPDGVLSTTVLFDFALTVARVDKLSMLFGYLFHLATFIAIVFSLHLRDTTQHTSGLLYAGSALGAVYAGDLVTLFLFWEMLAITSVFLILARHTTRARLAAMRYLIIQILSGVVLLTGILVIYYETGSIQFGHIGLSGLGSWLIFLAFGVKCCFPLLHNWLTDAYPEATPTGTVFLSAFTTKVAVYALARGYAGTEIMIYIGAVMTVFPIFYAVLEDDLRRVLSYSMINQVGFMVVGIGLGTDLAMNGALSHVFNDVIFKSLLFMSMGAVLFRTGKISCSQIGGLYKSMPWTTGLCIIGAASISGFPLFSAFVSKSMVMAAALEEGYPVVWLVLLFAAAGVLHHAGIKIPFYAFFAHDSGIRCKEAPTNMLVAMGIAAVICIFNGSYPWVLYSLLPFPVDYEPYTAAHVMTQSQLLFFAVLAFCVLKITDIEPPELPGVNIDSEWVYRWFAPRFVRVAVRAVRDIRADLYIVILKLLSAGHGLIFRHHGPNGMLARSMTASGMVIWVAVLLAVYLVVYFM